MYKIQCDKNLIKILTRFLNLISVDAEISEYSPEKTEICIIRSTADIPESFVPEADYIIINSDDKKIAGRFKGIKCKIITCGLSTRSSVTFSSISDSTSVLCLQRSIFCPDGKKLPPFELPFELIGKTFDEVSVLMIITAALLCGAEISQLKKIYL